MKKVLKCILWLIVILLIAMLAHPLWVSPLARSAVKNATPQVLGVDASLASLNLNLYNGHMALNNFQLVNPVSKGYSENNSFQVGKVEVKLDPMSVFSDVIHIQKIEIADPQIRYELKGLTSNFSAMLEGMKEKSEAEPKKEGKEKDESKKGGGKKVIIDEVSLHGATVTVATGLTLGTGVPLPLPPITLKDIGKESNGTSIGNALFEILGAVQNGASAIASGAIKGAGAVGEAAIGAATNLVGGAVNAIGNTAGSAVKSVSGVIGKGLGALTGGASAEKPADAATAKDAGKGAADAAKETAKDGKNAVKDAVKGASDTAKDAAKGVTDAVKSIGGLFGGKK